MPAVDLTLSFTYARALYDRRCKTLRNVLESVCLSLLYLKLNHSGDKSRRKSRGHGKRCSKNKQKVAPPQLKDYRGLLLLMVIISALSSTVDVGEARRFSGRVVEGVYESAAGNAIEVC